MKYILDTNTLLWIVTDDQRLSKIAKSTYLKTENIMFLSVASLWEIVIKVSLKKLEIKLSLENFIEQHIIGNDIKILNIESVHLYSLEKMPFHHRDPFDRLIISQAIYENMSVISFDQNFDSYPIKRTW